MAAASPPTAIAELRRQLGRMESRSRSEATVLPFGLSDIDSNLPGGGLALGHVHEVVETGSAGEYAGVATLFVAGSRERKPLTKPHDMYEPDLHIDTLKVKARNFR